MVIHGRQRVSTSAGNNCHETKVYERFVKTDEGHGAAIRYHLCTTGGPDRHGRDGLHQSHPTHEARPDMSQTTDRLPGFVSATLFTAATRPLPGGATVFHLDGDRFGSMQALVDLSINEDVLEARASEQVPAGSMISLGFEAPGTPARRGEVVHCDLHGDRWHVGIRLGEAA